MFESIIRTVAHASNERLTKGIQSGRFAYLYHQIVSWPISALPVLQSVASFNLIRLESHFQKPQNQFRKLILNILASKKTTFGIKVCITLGSPVK